MDNLVENYGYVIVFVVVTLGCAGLPLPSAAVLAAAAVYAGTTHQLNIWVLIGVAVVAAVLGNLIGYWLGRRGGPSMLDRFGPRLGLDERRQRVGQYVFVKYGGRAILFGRFSGLTRAWMGVLAGVNGMPWGPFLRFSVIGAIVWALVWGLGSYLVGDTDHNFSIPGGLLTWAILAYVAFIMLRRAWRRLVAEAEEEEEARADPTGSAPPA